MMWFHYWQKVQESSLCSVAAATIDWSLVHFPIKIHFLLLKYWLHRSDIIKIKGNRTASSSGDFFQSRCASIFFIYFFCKRAFIIFLWPTSKTKSVDHRTRMQIITKMWLYLVRLFLLILNLCCYFNSRIPLWEGFHMDPRRFLSVRCFLVFQYVHR